MRRFPVLRMRFPQQLTSSRDNLSGPGNHIGHLKAHAGPGALSLAATMDTNDAVTDLDIGHRWILPDYFPAKDRGVEGNGAGRVRSPDDVFESFDVHG